MDKKEFTIAEAQQIGEALGIDFRSVLIDEFKMGLGIELEHGIRDLQTNVTNNSELETGKIAWAHLKEISDYYTRLKKMEAEAEGK